MCSSDLPSFEAADEFDRLAGGFAAAFAKWPSGSYMLWYPAKQRRATDALAQAVIRTASTKLSPDKVVRIEFSVAPQIADGRLVSAGLLVVNPPWTLVGELKTILPELEKPLGLGGAARFRVESGKL